MAAVTSEDPIANSHTAPSSTDISATYDEPIQAGSATTANFVVHSESIGLITATDGVISVSGNTVTLNPNNDFPAGDVINVTSTAGIMGTTAGTPRVWTFRTANTGSGIFAMGQTLGSDPTGEVTFGDVDGDGDLDALESGGGGQLWLNDGTANFTATGQTVPAGDEAKFGDVDGDGDIDAVGTGGVWLNDGTGVFSDGGGAFGGQGDVEIGDLDGDGDLDVMVGVNYTSNRVFLNNGSGSFTNTGQTHLGSASSRGIEFGDFDDDGDLDVWVANNGGLGNTVWRNDGAGNLTQIGGNIGGFRASLDVDLGDVDGDGDLDAFVINNNRGNTANRVYLNDGNGVFTPGQTVGGLEFNYSGELADVDGDGDLDAIVNQLVGGGGPSRIHLNDGTGSFSDSGQLLNNTRSYGVDVGDLDGDGDMDLWFAGNSQPTQIWINQNLNPDVTVSVDNTTVGEAAGVATVSVSIAAAHTSPITVDLGFGGTATDGTDYTASGTQIVIPTGSTTGSVTVTAIQDTLDEADETVTISMASITNGQGTGQVTVTITDDDDPPTVSLALDNATLAENGGTGTVTATLSAASGQDVTVDLATSGTASGADFALSGTQITIAAGSTSGTVSITATDDAVDEPDETVVIDIAAATGATEDGTQQVTATIADDDEPPTVSIAVDNESIAEDGGVAIFTVSLSAPSTGDNTVDLAVSGTATGGTDYNLSATQVVIPAGSTSGSVTATSIADVEITEGGETIIVDIAAVTGNATEDGVQQATTTIVDDVNGPDVTIAVDNTTIAEAGGTATVTATLANAFGLPVTVNLALGGTATDGADYTASTVQIVVPVGSTTGTAAITATDDALIEGDETIVVDIDSVINGNNAGTQQTITITDDETPPTVTLSVDTAAIAEAGGVATFTATLSAATTLPVTVDVTASGSATAGADYTLSGNQIVIAAGSTTGTVTATAIDDGSDDDDETITLDITGVVNATEDGTQQQTVTITDDDEAPPLPPGPTPPNAAIAAPQSTVVGYTFGSDIPADAATDQTFTVHSQQTGQLVGADTNVSQNGATALHTPAANFKAGELVHATVTSALGPKAVWTFRAAVGGGLGTFTNTGQLIGQPATNARTFAVAVGDVDGDGDLDAFTPTFANTGAELGSRVYLNNGDATFTDSGQSIGTNGGTEVELGDIDGDGDIDAFVSRYGANRVYRNDGLGNFTDTGASLGNGTTRETKMADLDGDGDLDAVSANNGANVFWRNDGNGNFSSGQALGNHNSRAVALGDVDNDGDIDIFIGNERAEPDRLWLNDGNGNFTDSGQVVGNPAIKRSFAVALGDVDNDGDLDAWTGGRDYVNRLFENDGNGVFTDTGQQLEANPGGPGRTVGGHFGDFDADGDLDILDVQQNNGINRVWTNDGNGVFTVANVPGTNRYTPDGAVGDFDNDGDLDFFFTGDNQPNNDLSTANVWTNDNPNIDVTLSIDNATVAEAAGTATVTATLSAAAAGTVTINLGFSGTASASDFTASGTQIVIAGGATSGSITITAVQDAVDEPDETVIVDITSSTGANEPGVQQVTTTILDDDEPLPDVTLAVDNASIPEASGVATFTATLSAAATAPVTIDLALSGTAAADDYTASATQIVIAAGSTSGSITVTATQDDADEPDETVIVDISNVTGGAESGTQQATTTITDDDEPVMPDVTLAVDQASIAEAAGVAVFTVTLSEATTAPVTVDVGLTGTADASDYTVSATQVVIAAGATSGTVTVTAVQDEVNEPDETVIVDITNVAGGNESGDQQATTTIVDDDTPPSFRVTSLTATDSGFVIEFNSQLDGSALNMYDTQNAGLGAADVTVSGATSGNVVGSLVIGTNSVEFIKSGDSLGADTYTVTLRSADDGFKDDGGALLDGDGDGAAGGDYSNSFTVDAAPEGARTVSIPDFVRGPGQDVNLPADGTTGIPISISDGTNVRAADIRISYDPALLQITGATAPAGGTVVVNTTTPGLAILVYFATTALPAGPSDFINLQATVPTENASANYRSQQVLDVHDVIIGDGNDNEFPAVVDDAFHLNTYFADVSGNGRINASDAAQVARFAALIDSGFAASLNADPIIVGDISGNGRINAADASRVAQFAALIPVPEIPPVPGGILINGVFDPTVVDATVREVNEPAEASLGFREYPDTYGFVPPGNAGGSAREAGEIESAVDEVLEDVLDDLVEDLAVDLLGESD